MKNGIYIFKDGNERWYKDGKSHRNDGPADIWLDGYKAWYINGICQRIDGPAIILSNGALEWSIYTFDTAPPGRRIHIRDSNIIKFLLYPNREII